MNTGHMPRSLKADPDRPCAICGHKESNTLFLHGKIGELEAHAAKVEARVNTATELFEVIKPLLYASNNHSAVRSILQWLDADPTERHDLKTAIAVWEAAANHCDNVLEQHLYENNELTKTVVDLRNLFLFKSAVAEKAMLKEEERG